MKRFLVGAAIISSSVISGVDAAAVASADPALGNEQIQARLDKLRHLIVEKRALDGTVVVQWGNWHNWPNGWGNWNNWKNW